MKLEVNKRLDKIPEAFVQIKTFDILFYAKPAL